MRQMNTKIQSALLLCFCIAHTVLYGYTIDDNPFKNKLAGNKNVPSENAIQPAALSITENKGQIWDEFGKPAKRVKYYLHTDELQIFLLDKGLAYQFTKLHYPKGYHELR